MNQINGTSQSSSLVDKENACISYSETTRQFQQRLALRGGPIPTSHMRRPKFRKLFDRHILTYRF